MTPDINFLRHRPLIRLNLSPAKQVREALHHIGVAISGAALVSAIAGYGALMLGRDVPTAFALGATGSVGLAVNTRLKE
jgi:predicted RND superfamily exporter protein